MKAFLKGLLVLLLFVGIANAAQNLRQKDDGTAVWERFVGAEQIEIPVGSVYLTAKIDNLAVASSVAVAIPITASEIRLIQAALGAAITTADETFHFSTVRSGSIVAELTSASVNQPSMGMGNNGLDIGTIASYTPVSATNGNMLHQGDVLILQNEGLTSAVSNNATPSLIFTITVAPR